MNANTFLKTVSNLNFLLLLVETLVKIPHTWIEYDHSIVQTWHQSFEKEKEKKQIQMQF